MFYDTIIIGAGASGCMCALMTKNKNFAVIDKANKVAKKLLVTGNGRCNLTNLDIEDKFYNTQIKKYVDKFSLNDTLEFFKSLGLVLSYEEGRVYPLSNSAKSVVDVIDNQFVKRQIPVYLEHTVTKIEHKDNVFYIQTDKNDFSCRRLVVASGGNSVVDFLKENNIKFRDFCPSLCSIKTGSTRNLANVRVHDALLTVSNGVESKSERGEVLFKESGISGIVAFNLSSFYARNNNFNGKLYIDLLPDISEKEVFNLLTDRKTLCLPIPQFFDGLFVRDLGYEILNRVKIDEKRTSDKLTDIEIANLSKLIKKLAFEVKGFYPNNQVYSGGVFLDALDESLQCKTLSNLFFCGEVCDVDGICGGYNLQWAWTSGAIVGRAIE